MVASAHIMDGVLRVDAQCAFPRGGERPPKGKNATCATDVLRLNELTGTFQD
jgi:hypothetical protein